MSEDESVGVEPRMRSPDTSASDSADIAEFGPNFLPLNNLADAPLKTMPLTERPCVFSENPVTGDTVLNFP
ncbi:hypothetical protein D3C84_1246320 [compost metagenome]